MPNTASALKRMRQNQKRKAHNRAIKSRIKTLIRHFEESIESGNQEESQAALQEVQSALDKAAKKGVLHHNTTSRKKSRLAQQLHAAFAPPAAAAASA